MINDYAKRTAFRRTPHRNVAAIVVIASAVAIVALLILLFLQQHQQQHQRISKAVTLKVSSVNTEKASAAIPNYDFYTALTRNN